MRRVFTKPMCNGRYPAGDIRDYPLPTWRMFGADIDAFSRPADEAAANDALREQGEPAQPKRRGRPPKPRRHQEVDGDVEAA